MGHDGRAQPIDPIVSDGNLGHHSSDDGPRREETGQPRQEEAPAPGMPLEPALTTTLRAPEASGPAMSETSGVLKVSGSRPGMCPENDNREVEVNDCYEIFKDNMSRRQWQRLFRGKYKSKKGKKKNKNKQQKMERCSVAVN